MVRSWDRHASALSGGFYGATLATVTPFPWPVLFGDNPEATGALWFIGGCALLVAGLAVGWVVRTWKGGGD